MFQSPEAAFFFFWRIHTGFFFFLFFCLFVCFFFFFFFSQCEFFKSFLWEKMTQICQILRGEKPEIATFRQQVPAFWQHNMARILILANVFSNL